MKQNSVTMRFIQKSLLLLFLIPVLTHAQTGEKNFIDQNYIEVTGKAELEISPDLIYITIIIQEKDNKTKAPLAEREKQMIEKLESIGIDTKKDLLIKDLASNFRNNFMSKSEILLSKGYRLITHDSKTASKVFIELEKLDISNVSIEKLDHTKIQTYRRDVKVAAIKAAKEKSEALAAGIGQNIGRAIYVQEIENDYK
jgi:uncharacterized protein